jgi:hypothetical protein
VFVLGVPLEELLYAGAAGLAGTVFVPFVRGEQFVPMGARVATTAVRASWREDPRASDAR